MTRRQAIRLWRAGDRKRAAYRNGAKGIINTAFDQQIKPLYDLISEIDDIRTIEVPPLNNKAMEEAYMKMYVNTGVDFAMDKRRELNKSFIKSEDDIAEDLIAQAMRAYVAKHAGETITVVGDTSYLLLEDLVKEIVQETLDSGVSVSQAQTMLRDRISSAWHEMKRYRTERIVRTEIARASNFGSLEGAKSLNVRLEKVWISAFAGESRPAHMDANGQAVDLEGVFVVDGEELEYPADPAGSPGNTINCLCSTYEKVKE